MIRKHLATVVAATVLAGGLVGLSAGAAHAYPRVNKCGSAYDFKRSWDINDIHYVDAVVGFIDIYYNRGNGYNCAIARGNDAVVTGQHEIFVEIRRSRDGSWIQDGVGSNYTSYAGPVYAYGKGACIDFIGGLKYNEFSGSGDTGYSSVHGG
ncbi:hypothetical protein ACFU6K_34475 [Kitasatospora sp. NPDC057512]|uniref:hypothetical protein n=1 Tax=Kitasatospora sp. NPDC057512 TaxID=3346154 RepID=UPI003689C540